MKIIPKTKKDFAWVNFTPKQIEDVAKKHIEKLKKDITDIKSIPKEKRTFDNSVEVIGEAGLHSIHTNTIALLSYVSPDEKIRKIAAKMILDISKKQLNIMQDEDLFKAFSEFKPKNLEEDQLRLYKDMKKGFENMGFHLPKKEQAGLLKIKNEINKLEQKASMAINNDRKIILCTREELDGMDDGFIQKLPKDKKTGKYIVSTDYPEFKPFSKNATNQNKRKELIDKDGSRGGKKNLDRLAKILILRDQKAKILGYKNHAEYVLEEKIAKNPKNVDRFLVSNLSRLKVDYQNLKKKIEKTKGSKLEYFDFEYYFNEFIKENYSVDELEIKQYFELNKVLLEIFKLFGGLFKVTFTRNKEIGLWYKDVFMYDVIEDGKKIAHIMFDLFPRKGKYNHACHWTMGHGCWNEKEKGYEAPLTTVIANYSKATKDNPTLLTFWDVEALYHEFGHACHSLLTRARYGSQSGTSVRHDFVETPSQLFEMWLDDSKYLQSVSSNYKTGEHLSLEVLEKIKAMRSIQSLDQNFRTFVLALFDLKIHLNPKSDILKIRDTVLKEYSYLKIGKDSLWPASFGHIFGGYDVGYYAYMWALVYSYDIFSRFKKEGIMNKKVGMELRRKILEKGDSEDALKLMTDFLGRKPNNKAFLEALK